MTGMGKWVILTLYNIFAATNFHDFYLINTSDKISRSRPEWPQWCIRPCLWARSVRETLMWCTVGCTTWNQNWQLATFFIHLTRFFLIKHPCFLAHPVIHTPPPNVNWPSKFYITWLNLLLLSYLQWPLGTT